MYLPNKTIETAGTKIPIIGTKIEGNQLATMSEDIIIINLMSFYFRSNNIFCGNFINR